MDSDRRVDDMMSVHIRVFWPLWLEELSAEEFANVMKSARRCATKAFESEISRAERFWKERRDMAESNQMSIYDYA